MRGLESSGLSRQQAESLTSYLTEVICANKEKIAEAFVSKHALEKVRKAANNFMLSGPAVWPELRQQLLLQAVLEQEARIAGFKSEVSKSQELHHASLTRDTERLTNNYDKIRAEIRWVLSPKLGART